MNDHYDGFPSPAPKPSPQLAAPVPVKFSVVVSPSVTKLVTALGKAQSVFLPVKKNAVNPFYNNKPYADLESIIGATRTALIANGLTLTQLPISIIEGEKPLAGVITALFHESGEFIQNELLLPATAMGSAKYDAQTIGAAITYARRISRQAILDVAGETDDDANDISEYSQEAENKRNRAPERPSKPNPAPAIEAPSRSQSEQRGPSLPSKNVADPRPFLVSSEAPTKSTEPSPVESATSEPPKPQLVQGETNSDTLPTDEAYKIYFNKARKVTEELSAAGLQPSPGQSVGAKYRSFIFTLTAKTELKQLTVADWEKVLAFPVADVLKQINEGEKK